MKMKFAFATDIGVYRKNNEDATWAGTNSFGQYVTIVCDGLGGYKGGQAASHITIEIFKKNFMNNDFSYFNMQDFNNWIANTIKESRNAITSFVQDHLDQQNMATTLVISILVGTKLYTFNVGDSRAYIANAKETVMVTEDQNLLTHLKHIKAPYEQYKKFKSDLYAITQYIGITNSKQTVFNSYYNEITKNDCVILTSDGIHNFIIDDLMYITIKQSRTLDNACEQIIRLGIAGESNDNLSLAILCSEDS